MLMNAGNGAMGGHNLIGGSVSSLTGRVNQLHPGPCHNDSLKGEGMV